MNKFIILYGLPGSGKTTFAENLKNEKKKIGVPVNVVNCDSMMQKARQNNIPLEQQINRYLCWSNYCYERKTDYYTVFDGLFTTINDIVKLVEMIKTNVQEDYEISVEYWKENRDACVWNDEGRRDENSIATIKTLTYEIPNLKTVEEATGVKMTFHRNNVVRKSQTKRFADLNGIYIDNNGYLYSESWGTGGISCNCWGNSSIHDGDDPLYFDAFDELILKVNPDLNFMAYNKIKKKCVEIDSYSEGDYYGGSIGYARYRCKLSEVLEELEDCKK